MRVARFSCRRHDIMDGCDETRGRSGGKRAHVGAAFGGPRRAPTVTIGRHDDGEGGFECSRQGLPRRLLLSAERRTTGALSGLISVACLHACQQEEQQPGLSIICKGKFEADYYLDVLFRNRYVVLVSYS